MSQSSLPVGFIFSQSSLQDYSDCPQRFHLRYIQQLKWPAVESEPALINERRLQDGRLFHRLVQQHLIGVPPQNLSRLVSSPDVQRWWENYQAHPNNLADYDLHTELTLSAPLAGTFRLLAKYDLLAVQAGKESLIYDWKTYARRPRDETMLTRWQTRVYRALLVLAGTHLNGEKPILPEKIMMIYWYADYPAEPARFSYSTSQFDRDMDALGRMVAEISTAADFPRTDDEKKCSYCVYRSYCDRKVVPGVDELLESELEEPRIDLEQIQEISF